MTDEDYLGSYARTDIHAEMLNDRERTHTYRRAILDEDLEGKVVLDVGCGTGILSLFAAEAGARKVYAVEASDLAGVAEQIIADNGFSDTIQVMRGRLEELTLPSKVDVIVSEWMGYFLLFERMLDSVLVARDRWLKPGGKMLPRRARVLLCGIEDFEYEARRFGWWDDVYGYDLSAMAERCRTEALVESVDGQSVMTSVVPVLEIDVATMDVDDQDFEASFELGVTRHDTMHAMLGSFDVAFGEGAGALVLCTDPFAPTTHWKQTIFYLDRPLKVRRGDVIQGHIAVRRDPRSPRCLIIDLRLRHRGQERRGTYHL